jgi:hypothetical protein
MPYIGNNTINGGMASTTYCIYMDTSYPNIFNNILFSDVSSAYGIYDSTYLGYPNGVNNNDIFCAHIYYYTESSTSGEKTLSEINDSYLPNCELNISTEPTFVSLDGTDGNINSIKDNDWHLDNGAASTIKTGGLDASGYADFPLNDNDDAIDKDNNVRTISWSIGAYENDL